MNEEKEGLVFKVIQKNGLTIIENHSNLNIIISLKPVPPKRKYNDIILIRPNSFKLFDKHYKIDLTTISFSMEN